MAAPDWSTFKRYQLKSRSCSCGWGCTSPFATSIPDNRCLILGRCDCGWNCIRHRNFGCRQGTITWTQALFGPMSRLRIQRFDSAKSEHCLRLGDLADLASRFTTGSKSSPPLVLYLKTVKQIREWFWWLADQQRIADRYLARARSFNNAVTAARLSLLPRSLRPRSRSRPRSRRRR